LPRPGIWWILLGKKGGVSKCRGGPQGKQGVGVVVVVVVVVVVIF